MKPILLLAATFAIVGSTARAGQNWDGTGGDDNWNTPANWDGDSLPTFTNPINFGGNLRNGAINNLGADSTIGGINLTNDSTSGKTNAFTLSGARITLGGDITTTTSSSAITDTISLAIILDGNRTITTNTNHNLTVGGIVSETGGARNLIKNGTGTLTLSNTNTYSGGTTISAGTLTLKAGPYSNGTITLNQGATLDNDPTSQSNPGNSGTNAFNISNAINLSGSAGTATIKFSRNDTKYNLSGSVTGASGVTQTLAIIQGSTGGAGDRQNILFSGVIANGGSGGTLGLNIDFAGASGTGQNAFVNLSGQNSFTGPISVTNTKGLTGGAYVTIGGEQWTASHGGGVQGSGYLGGGNYSNTISLATGVILDYFSSANQTLGGVISGGGSIIKEGSGTLNLTNTNANTYSGGTTVNSGILSLGTGGTGANTSSVGALGTNTVTLNTGGQVRLWIKNDASFTIANNFTMNGGVLHDEDGNYNMTGAFSVPVTSTFSSKWAAKDLTISGAISGAGGVTINNVAGNNGGAVIFSNAGNSYAGVTTISASTLQISTTANGGGNSTLGASSNAATNLVFNGGILRYAGAGAGSTDRLFTLNTSGGTIQSTSGTAANSLSFTNTGAIAYGGSGARTLTLGGANTGNNVFRPVLGDSGGATTLQKSDAGTWFLTNTNANTYTGGTTVNAGILSLGTGGTAANTSSVGALGTNTVTINTGGQVRLWIKNDASFTIANNFTMNGGVLHDEDGNYNMTGAFSVPVTSTFSSRYTGKDLTISGAISGAGGVTINNVVANNGGAVIFSNAGNSYAGVTTISASTLQISTTANGGGNSTLGASINAATNLVFNGGILRYAGAGAGSTDRLFTLNTSGGTIQSTSGTAANSLSFTNTGAIAYGGSGARTLTLGGANTGNNVLNAVLGDSGGATTLQKSDAGKWRLTNGSNSYTGATNVSAGTLEVTANNALGSTVGGTTVASGATLAFDGAFNYSTAEKISISGSGVGGVGAINKTNGNGVLSTSISPAGNATIGSGTAGSTLTLTSDIITASTLTFTGAGNTVVSGNLIAPATNSVFNLNNLATGDYAFTAASQSFNARVDNVGGTGWLLVGRGREGWQFDADGQGLVADVNQNLGTSAAFAPALYSDAIINDLLAQSGLNATNAEVRLRRATNAAGTTWQEARWRNFSNTSWTSVLSNPGSNVQSGGLTGVTREIVSGTGSPSTITNQNTMDSGSNDFGRIFTWAWSSHDNQRGFSYGNGVNLVNGSSATNFLWEFTNENHEIPYTEIYVRSLAPATPGNISKTGTGTLTLSGANTYTGTTTVSQGKLLVNGSIIPSTGSSAVTVASGATLGGSGTLGSTSNNVNVTIQAGGTLAPGTSPGVLTEFGTVTMNSGSIFETELAFGGVAGPGNGTDGTDRLIVNGGVTINDAILAPIWGGQTKNLFRGGVPTVDHLLWLIVNDLSDPIGGSLFLNDGVMINSGLQGLFGAGTSPYLVSGGGGSYALFYDANFDTTALTGGNDLLLIAIPEPSRALLALLALLPLALRRRR